METALMKYRYELVLAVIFTVIFAAFCYWQAPGSRLTSAEIDDYLARIDAGANLPPEEKTPLLTHLRAWGEADDGEPVYMYNLMSYRDQLLQRPGLASQGTTPQEVNQYYEDAAIALLLKRGNYPVLGNAPQGVRSGTFDDTNLIDYSPALNHWDRLLVVRYSSRRDFFELVANPEYLKFMPYKFIASEVALVPTSAELVVPDLRFVLGSALLVLFLLIGWIRAARRS
jgi:hypothetical protein